MEFRSLIFVVEKSVFANWATIARLVECWLRVRKVLAWIRIQQQIIVMIDWGYSKLFLSHQADDGNFRPGRGDFFPISSSLPYSSLSQTCQTWVQFSSIQFCVWKLTTLDYCIILTARPYLDLFLYSQDFAFEKRKFWWKM